MLYSKCIKRILDLGLSLVLLVLLAPAFLAIALWVKADSPGPVLFSQKRVGRAETHFYIFKFRTMRVDTPANVPTHLLQNPGQWITRSGRFLRKTSLDELPQLINIIKGEMSFVGPRPALYNQLDLVELRRQNGAAGLRPGLTGWAQVNGRDALELCKKAWLDGEYAQRISFAMDFKCLLKTAKNVLTGEGVVEGAAPAAEEAAK